jgi:SPFH domain / Band 7 family
MSKLKSFSFLTLLATLATGASSCSSGAVFGVTSWETLSAGQVAAVYHAAGGEKDKVDIYTGKFNYGPFDKVLVYSTGQQLVDFSSRTDQGKEIDQSIHFAAQNIKGTINVQVIIMFEPTQESVGTVAKVLRVDEEHFKAQNLYASTQNAIIQVGAGMDPATFNSNLPEIATKVQTQLQKEYGKMIKIQEVRITGIADFGKSFNDQLAQQSALKAATANEASKLKLIQAKKATLEAEAINIKAIDPSVRDYQLKVKRLEIEATLAEKGISPYATGVTLTPSK